jgi:predicted nucleic acid-binding protein
MPAGDRFFVDTNVLLYDSDPADPDKQRRARLWVQTLWEHGAGVLSWQVLHEFYVNATRKLRSSASQARSIVAAFTLWQPVDTSDVMVQRAWYWMDDAGLPYWDALILAAAERRGCAWLLSEDFQAGRKLGAVTIVNPFRALPAEFGLDQSRGRRR